MKEEKPRERVAPRAQLIYFINILSKDDLMVESEIGWVSRDKMILTINNRYYMLCLPQNMIGVRHRVFYGR